ncbi:O-methyltransferase [Ilumatobacter sp.]|uniref:O-methyltransferase n=1 Tax=Ilumatobacter sp. TaxID=1967498 RepID=UPI003AF6B936
MRWIEMTDELYDYVTAHASPRHDPVSERLAATTRERFERQAGMNIGADQGRFLATLVAVSGARLVVEVGTFTGMSALWMARALPDGGRLICFDITDRYLETARAAWREAGVDDRIEVRIGPAAEGLAELDRPVDLAFIDADKTGYATYLDLLLPRLSEHGVIVVDNVLWSGAVVDDSIQDDDTVALRTFNHDVAARDDVQAVMLPIGDGVTLIRRR